MVLSYWKVTSMIKMDPLMVNWWCQWQARCCSSNNPHYIPCHNQECCRSCKHQLIIIFIKRGTLYCHQAHNFFMDDGKGKLGLGTIINWCTILEDGICIMELFGGINYYLTMYYNNWWEILLRNYYKPSNGGSYRKYSKSYNYLAP